MRTTKKWFFMLIGILLLGCNSGSCVMQPPIRVGDDKFSGALKNADEDEKRLVKYITERTVRVVIQCQVVDTTTKKVISPYKDSGWGTGAVVLSTKNYSLIQTAAHVVKVEESGFLNLKSVCDRFYLEKRNTQNKIIKTYDKVSVYKKDPLLDIAVLMVPYNLGVSSKFADSVYIGQKVRLVGYPFLRGVEGKHISYSNGYVMTANMGTQKTWDGINGLIRLSAVGYFGNSGGAVWTSDGKIIGIVTSMIGFRIDGKYLPHHGHLYCLGLGQIKKFYSDKKIELF